MLRTYHLFLLALLLSACNTSTSQTTENTAPKEMVARKADPPADYSKFETPSLDESGLDNWFKGASKAIFASGCFWCTEEVFQRVKGVQGVYSGYIGGTKDHPTYYGVGSGQTDYTEAVIVYYNPEQVSYELLLEFFYASHDPTQLNRQGPDVGRQYRGGIFYLDDVQKEAATLYQTKLDASGKYSAPIATEITAASTFYLAEDYHQDYYPAHPENTYIQRVSKPKVEKFVKAYGKYLKEFNP